MFNPTMRWPRGVAVMGAGLALSLPATGTIQAQARVPARESVGNRITAVAASYRVGSYGGQCKVFAQNVVNAALAARGFKARVGGYGSPGGAYYGTYRRAGGVRIPPNSAMPGDLIQVISPKHKTSDFPPRRDALGRSMLHTAIVIGRYGPGNYRVRDSNWRGDETVFEHRWQPGTWRSHGIKVYVWRFGSR